MPPPHWGSSLHPASGPVQDENIYIYTHDHYMQKCASHDNYSIDTCMSSPGLATGHPMRAVCSSPVAIHVLAIIIHVAAASYRMFSFHTKAQSWSFRLWIMGDTYGATRYGSYIYM